MNAAPSTFKNASRSADALCSIDPVIPTPHARIPVAIHSSAFEPIMWEDDEEEDDEDFVDDDEDLDLGDEEDEDFFDDDEDDDDLDEEEELLDDDE